MNCLTCGLNLFSEHEEKWCAYQSEHLRADRPFSYVGRGYQGLAFYVSGVPATIRQLSSIEKDSLVRHLLKRIATAGLLHKDVCCSLFPLIVSVEPPVLGKLFRTAKQRGRS